MIWPLSAAPLCIMRLFSAARRGSYGLASSSGHTLHLPPGSLTPSLPYFIFIVSLQVLIIVTLTVVVFVEIVLQPYNSKLATKGQVAYTLLITLTATVIAAATESELRKLWTCVVINGNKTNDGEESGARTARQTSVVLGLSKMGDLVRTAYIPLVFGLIGLVTTAIVTGLQPTSAPVTRDMPIVLFQARNLSGSTRFTEDCIQETWSTPETLPSRWFTWPFTASPARNITISSTRRSSQDNRCSTDYILSTFQTLQNRQGSLAYTLPGSSIQVHRSAAGVPYDLMFYRGIPGMNPNTYKWRTSAFGTWSPASFEWASMCVPLVSRRVAACRPGDNVKRMMNRVEVIGGNCTIGRTIHNESESENGEMVAGACTEGRRIGTATLLIGATGEYAGKLRDAVFSPDVEWPERPEREFAVACDVDLTNSLTFQRILIAPFDRDSQTNEDEAHTWLVTGAITSADGNSYKATQDGERGETCTPFGADGTPLSLSHFLTAETLATGAASSWQLLAENMYQDGHLSTLMNAAEEADSSFPESLVNRVSRSALEELLSLAASIAVGFHLGANTGQIMIRGIEQPDPSIQGLYTELRGGSRAYQSVRVGSGELWGLVFILPEVAVLSALGWLWWNI
ncbi:hypothetical protein NCS52_00757400 [Fusarium sp. LHS14.1]|nr:hypothetical protein NCS52_00757400 [Fusarium sp. LHS14.1]